MSEDEEKQSQPQLASGSLRAMADKIDLNHENGFAGAFVIAPPEGEPIELLLLNNQQSPAVFWSLLKTTAEMALVEIQENEKQQGGWGR